MQLICRKCESSNIEEKESGNIHGKAVYCKDCNAWIKWGGIEPNEVQEGEQLAKVISAEEKEKLILVLLENESKTKVKFFIWKNSSNNKYNHVTLNSMLAGFNSNISKFTSIEQIVEFILDKNVYITVRKKDFKGKIVPEIIRWRPFNK